MKLVFLPAFILGLLAWSSTSSTSNTPVKASTPLSADEVVIYKAVLGKYSYEALLGQSLYLKRPATAPQLPTRCSWALQIQP